MNIPVNEHRKAGWTVMDSDSDMMHRKAGMTDTIRFVLFDLTDVPYLTWRRVMGMA